ncbi:MULTISPECIES: monovalent cation:proton antiporter-2 (CPA2) family protein [Roseobacteraceae]|uniref:Glutathione-regulated potassium-efflux system protein KefC n=1 Tax=Pseudosulfitobacter pseudonitzschiae TaxID=1402135 RepID=A0A221K1C7_9RHOB|nr:MULTISPECIES: monovalent cation:proton antiporter-2 (CPA2) family protein [Roseobacteraceae]ASM72798.1 glutathione-regulated potassium-efflux system protein KefC [Pseudosulfitobacter pseudonitzschiae]
MESFLYQASIYLLAAVIAVPIAARLGLGSVLGYLTAGILIGPVLSLVGSETESLQHFAEFGVVMMLFLIGLELEPRALWDMRHKLVGLGGLQVTLSTVVLMGLAMAYDQPWGVALAIGLTLSLSSTAIVLQTLSEKGLTQTNGGRSVFSVLLTQDIAVIPILAFLPLIAVTIPVSLTENGAIVLSTDDHHSMSLVEGLPAWGVTLVTIGAVAAVILAGVFLTRPVFRFIHSARLREMYTALALLIVVGISFLMMLVGLSPALGAFLAGVVLASSEFRHELETDLEPFKGLLLGLFFITVGAGINFPLLFGNAPAILSMALLVILLKGAILWVLAIIFRIKGRDRWLFALSLAQAGEFGFVLVSFSVGQGILPKGIAETLLLVIALSMLITPLLFILYEVISRHLAEGSAPYEPDEIDEKGPVIIAGIGRFGQIVNRLVQGSGFETVVLDHDMETIQLMRRFGVKGFLGDPTRPDILTAAGIMDARVLVVALDDPEAAIKLTTYARKLRPDLHIVARAHDRVHTYRQYQAGANDIVRETFDSSLRAGRYVLENVGLTEYEAAEAERVFYHHDRDTVRELAGLWKPGVKIEQNKEYIERAKELQRDLETALLSRETGQKRA